MTVDDILERTLGNEGGYSNNPNDRGGETMWGVTERLAWSYGYTADMKDLPRATAKEILRKEFVVKPKFDVVLQLSEPIAAELVDAGVNMGAHAPITWLQRWLNVFNHNGADFPDMAVDGALGTQSLAALRLYLRLRGTEGENILVRAINCSHGAAYLEIAEANSKDETFVYGWVRGRVS